MDEAAAQRTEIQKAALAHIQNQLNQDIATP
jgi:hypothetical protein